MRTPSTPTLFSLTMTGFLSVSAPLLSAAQQAPDSGEARRALARVEWREIGPANMGGRTVDVAGVPGDPTTLYMATATGGLWRTTDQATTWTSIFEVGATLSTGAVALAPSDRNVVYLGTGENNPRNSTSVGDGVWRSDDGGDTWSHLGLTETERIGRIRVHPDDPDRVWVAALALPERGSRKRPPPEPRRGRDMAASHGPRRPAGSARRPTGSPRRGGGALGPGRGLRHHRIGGGRALAFRQRRRALDHGLR